MTKTRTKNIRSLGGLGKAVTFGALSLSASVIPLSYAFALDDNALPAGGTVVGGSATLDYNTPNELNVYQGTDRAVINWDTFNIGGNATAQFHQPNSSSIVVNRVTGSNQDPSLILGSLKANGTVFVLDRNGVIFGANSKVDVGSIVVGTGTIDDSSFMSGDHVISIDNINPDASIINNGKVTVAEAGLAAFVAPTIVNNGIIEAKTGTVSLASGIKATIDLYGDKLVELATDLPLDHASITNTGTIHAEGGTVLITAEAAKKIVDTVINTSGIIDVSSVSNVGGKIVLEGANTEVSGTLDASGKTGGGKILVGGDYQGSGKVRHAEKTTITNTARLKANATGDNGNGGKVVVWADDTTQFNGTIEARSGSISGHGGTVETSGKINLGVNGNVYASGIDSSGNWLLDPSNVILVGTGGNSIPGTGGTNNPSADSYQINAGSIQSALNNGNNVTITTTNAAGTQSGDITTSGTVSINKTSGAAATLTLQADRNIFLANTTINSTSNALNIILNADNDANQNGAISITSSTITTNGGEFFAGGGADDGNDILDGFGNVVYDGIAGDGRADNFAIGGRGFDLNGTSSISTGTGNVTILGKGGIGVRLFGGSITTSSGNIMLVGQTTTSASNNIWGVSSEATSPITVTTTGAITISGISSGTGISNYGVNLNEVVTAKDGPISITGIAGSGTGDDQGARVKNVSSTGSGTITIKGKAGDVSSSDILLLAGGTGIGGPSTTSNIKLIADTLNIGGNVKTAGYIYITPRTASTAMGLGGGAGTLNLDDTELAYFNAGTFSIGDSAAGTGDIDVTTWDLSGKTHNVELYGNDINLGGLTLGTGNFKAYAMDNAAIDLGGLTVSAAITKSLAGSSLLTLMADQDIKVNASSAITASTGSLNILMNSDRNADLDGGIGIYSNITTNNGYSTFGGGNGIITAGTGYAWGNSANFLTDGTARYYGVGINATVNTGIGNIIVNGHGWNSSVTNTLTGVEIDGSSSKLQTTTGSIDVNGIGGAGAGSNYGVDIYHSGAITTTSGVVNVTGTGGAFGTGTTNNYGIQIASASVQSTGTGTGLGAVTLKGYAAVSSTAGAGIAVGFSGLGASLVSVANADLFLEGTGTSTSAGTGGHGIALQNGTGQTASIKSTGTGNISIIGTGATSTTGGGSMGVYVNPNSGTPNILSSGSGSITVTGTAGTGSGAAAYGINSNLANGIQNSGTGDVTLITDTISLGAANAVNSAHQLTIKPKTGSTTIGLGGGLGTLNLSDTWLGYLGVGTKLIIGDGVSGTGDIDLDSWDLSAKTYNIEIYGNDIDVGGLTLGTGDFLAHAMDNAAVDLGTLTVSAAMTKSVVGTSTLELRADKDIVFNSGSNVTASTGSLNIALNANRDADNDGAVNVTTSAFTTNGGWFVGGGGSGKLWGADGIKGTADDAASTGAEKTAAWGSSAYASGVYLSDGDISTSAGDIFLAGHGYNSNSTDDAVGVNVISGSVLQSSSGGITINGIGGNSRLRNFGVSLSNSSSEVKSTTGAISITGQGGTSGLAGSSANVGVYVGGGKVTSLGTASNASTITMVGTGANYTGDIGVRIANSGNISTTKGAIDITGNGAGTNGSGVVIDNSGRVSGAGGGTATIKLTGTSTGTGSDINVFNTGSNFIGGTTFAGDITLVGNTFTLSNLTAQTTGIITIKPRTASTSIGLGGGTGTLNLDDSELSYFNAGTFIIGDSLAGTGDITVDSWNLSGKAYSVELYGNDINFNDTDGTVGVDYSVNLGTGNFTAYAKDNGVDYGTITATGANGAFTKTLAGTSSLILRADNDIVFNANSGITTTAGLLNLVLNADRNANQDGAISITNSAFTTNGGYAVLGGGSGLLWGADEIQGNTDDAASTGADNVAAWGNSTYAAGVSLSGGSITTNAGTLLINGHGNNAGTSNQYGVLVSGTTLTTTSGKLSVSGTGGGTVGTSTANNGLRLESSALLQTTSGDLNIYGLGGGNSAAGNTNDGIVQNTGADLLVNGNGTINIMGQAGQRVFGSGYSLTDNGSTVINQNGAINITGTNSADPDYSSGVSVSSSALIESKGTGDIIMNGLRTTATRTTDNGLYFDTNARVLASGGANITLNGSVGGTDVVVINGATVFTSGGAGTGNITINGNTFSMVNTFGTPGITAAGTLWFKPRTASTTIGLGGGTGTLNIDDTELSYLNAGTLIIGDSTSGTGDIDLDSWNWSTKSHNIELYGNDIDIGGLTLGTGNFTAYAKNNGGDLGDLAISTAITKAVAGTSTISLRADNNVSNTGYNIASSSGALNMILTSDYENNAAGTTNFGTATLTSANGNITVNKAATATGNLVFNAGTGTFTTGSTFAAGTNDLTLIADHLVIGGAMTNSGTLTLKPYTNNTTVGLGGGSGTFNLDDTELGYISAGDLIIGSTASTGDVNIDTWDLSSKSQNVQIFGNDMNLAGLTLGSGDVTLYAKGGGIQVSAASTSNAASDLNLLSAYDILISEAVTNAGSGQINLFAGWDSSSAITTPALFNRDNVDLSLTARDITLGVNGSLSSNATGTAVLIAASDDFINNSSSGSSALAAGSGRYLVYASDPAETTKGGLGAKNIYNMDYNANAESTITGLASRFVFQYQPTLTLTADDITTTDPATAVYSYSYTGLVSGDTLSDYLSGIASYSLGALAGNTRSINLSAGTLTASNGYLLSLANGTMTVSALPSPPPPSPSPAPMTTPTVINDTVLNHSTNIIKVSIDADNSENAKTADAVIEVEGKAVNCLVSDASGCIVN